MCLLYVIKVNLQREKSDVQQRATLEAVSVFNVCFKTFQKMSQSLNHFSSLEN